MTGWTTSFRGATFALTEHGELKRVNTRMAVIDDIVKAEMAALKQRRADAAKPHPAGDPVRAFRTALRRAHKAEQTVRELRARITELERQETT